jgi:hypothetical protein
MLRKEIALLLVCAVTLLAFAPPRAFTQTPNPSGTVDGDRTPGGGQAGQRPDLKAAFAERVARIKSDPSAGGGIKRAEKKWQDPEPATGKQSGSSKMTKTKIILIVAGFTALGVVLALTLPDDAPPICETVPTDPIC